MNRVFLLLITTTIALFSNAQDFSGTLNYSEEIKIVPRLKKILDESGISEEMYLMKYGKTKRDTLMRAYNNGFIRESYTSDNSTWSIYSPETKLNYNFSTANDAISMVMNYSMDVYAENRIQKSDSYPRISSLDTTVLVGKYNLKVIEVKWDENMLIRYYYDENYLKTNPETFQHYIYEGFYPFLKLSNTLPIIVEKQTQEFITVHTLIQSSPIQIDKTKLFHIPKMKYDDELNGTKNSEINQIREYYNIKLFTWYMKITE